jgi:hypothetical protein
MDIKLSALVLTHLDTRSTGNLMPPSVAVTGFPVGPNRPPYTVNRPPRRRHTRRSGAGLGIKRHKPGFIGKARLVFGWFLGEGSDGDAKPVSGINRGVRGGLEMVVGSVV